jgi:CBS domain-containing protein
MANRRSRRRDPAVRGIVHLPCDSTCATFRRGQLSLQSNEFLAERTQFRSRVIVPIARKHLLPDPLFFRCIFSGRSRGVNGTSLCKGLAQDNFDALRATACDVMTPGIHCCRDDDDLAKAVQHMEKLKVRRLPVINKSKPVLQKRGIRLGTRIEKNQVFGSVDMLGNGRTLICRAALWPRS